MRNIYNLTKGKVEVYNIEPLRGDITAFRRSEFESLPYDERVLEQVQSSGWFTPRKNIIYECGAYVIKKSTPREEDEFVISEFVDNHVDVYSLNDVNRTDNGRNLTLLDPIMYLTDRRLQLTEDTLLELLLEREDYSSKRLQNGDLSKIRDLFRLSKKPVSIIDLEELKKYLSTSLVPEDELSKKMSQISGSTKVYRKLK